MVPEFLREFFSLLRVVAEFYHVLLLFRHVVPAIFRVFFSLLRVVPRFFHVVLPLLRAVSERARRLVLRRLSDSPPE